MSDQDKQGKQAGTVRDISSQRETQVPTDQQRHDFLRTFDSMWQQAQAYFPNPENAICQALEQQDPATYLEHQLKQTTPAA